MEKMIASPWRNGKIKRTDNIVTKYNILLTYVILKHDFLAEH
jgi:hypothetical protein